MLYALVIFLSALLLFQVQPIVGRLILPWYGGSSSVWTTCMLFFQALLLVGYAYSHLLASRMKPRTQAFVHIGMLAVAVVALLLFPPGNVWKPDGTGTPEFGILMLLAATIGLPYFALSSTAPLVQSWFARLEPGRSPYRLYALSHAGSLLALLSDPFVYERIMRLSWQTLVWKAGFVLFAVGCARLAWVVLQRATDSDSEMATAG